MRQATQSSVKQPVCDVNQPVYDVKQARYGRIR